MNTYDSIAMTLGLSPINFTFSFKPEDHGHIPVPGPNKPGYSLSEETKQRMRKPKGKPFHRKGKKLSESHKANLRKPNTEEHNKNISLAKQKAVKEGSFVSPTKGGHKPETKQKIAESLREHNNKIFICDRCGKSGKASGMQRWHFNNCSSQRFEKNSLP